ncbi:MAG: flotillin family protein, partial [Clostridia bacterium]|nr:flotillin family protein [Clostridia bacterium]
VASDNDSILRAAENFLGRRQDEIALVAQQVLEGNMREIVGQMKLHELVQNRDLFAQKVLENAAEDMKRMGLEIVNLTIQNFEDKNGVIQDLGVDNVVRIRKDAAISKANAEKDIAVAQAEAEEQSNKARAMAETNIALQNKDVAIKKSEYKKEQDAKQAEADAAYAIQEQEQRKSIETASVNADIAKREKEIELREKEVALAERILDAEIKKKADAEKYAIEQKAEAERYKREQDAIAKRIEQEQKAEADKLTASAKRFADEEEAKGIEAKGKAEAQAILAKAEAMKAMGEASILEMYLKVLPEVVKNAAEPLAQTDKIVMYGDGNATKVVKDVMNSASQITDGLAQSTGIDIKSLIEKFVSKD